MVQGSPRVVLLLKEKSPESVIKLKTLFFQHEYIFFSHPP